MKVLVISLMIFSYCSHVFGVENCLELDLNDSSYSTCLEAELLNSAISNLSESSTLNEREIASVNEGLIFKEGYFDGDLAKD